jgi:hypothetical protein
MKMGFVLAWIKSDIHSPTNCYFFPVPFGILPYSSDPLFVSPFHYFHLLYNVAISGNRQG